MKLLTAVLLPLSLAAAPASESFRIPLHFERVGASYVSDARGIRVTLGTGGAQTYSRAGASVQVRFAEGNPVRATGLDEFQTSVFRNGLPSKAWTKVEYGNVYPGIAVQFHPDSRDASDWEFDLIADPAADVSRIRWTTDADVALEASGDLVLRSSDVEVRWKKPVAYQEFKDGLHAVRADFTVQGRAIGLQIGAYDKTRTLVIDPTLAFSTYMGGTADEIARGIAVDTAGNVYVCGGTTSGDLPTRASSYQANFRGSGADEFGDAFIAKFTATGTVSYLTYLGGTSDDVCSTLAVDAAGAVYVAGKTSSRNFPVTSAAMQSSYGGEGGNFLSDIGDAFVAKLTPQGGLAYSTYAGGSADDAAAAITVDSAGNAYVAGITLSTNFPASGGAQPQFGGRATSFIPNVNGYISWHTGDAFVLKLDSSGARAAGTYLGGSLDDGAAAIALDRNNNVWVTGGTCSTNFPLQGALQTTIKGQSPGSLQPISNVCEGFVTRLSNTLAQITYSTYLGGNRDDLISGLAIDAGGAVYLTGATMSTDFPITSGAFQSTFAGPTSLGADRPATWGDAFVAKLDPATNRLVYATLIGGADDDLAGSIAVDSAGNAFITGLTKSSNFPRTSDALQSTLSGRGGQTSIGDGFLVKLDSAGTKLLYSSYVGGNSADAVNGMALSAGGTVYVTGGTISTDFPTTAGLQRTNSRNGANDVFVSAISGLGSGPTVGIANVASYNSSAIAPGEVVAIFVQGQGPSTLVTARLDSATGRVATNLSGTRVLFNNIPAPMVYTSASQLAAIVPYGLVGATSAQVVVEYNGVQLAPVTVPVAPAVPGLFSANQTGTGQGAIQNADGSYNNAANGAARGSIVVLYGTGQGQTVPTGVDGQLANSVFPVPSGEMSVTIGGIAVPASDILFKGPIPAIAEGFWQINVRLPATLGPGTHAVKVTVGGRSSQDNLTLVVQ